MTSLKPSGHSWWTLAGLLGAVADQSGAGLVDGNVSQGLGHR